MQQVSVGHITIVDVNDGKDGVNGADSIYVMLTNPVFTFTSSSTGAITTYSLSGTDVYVYEGNSTLTYDGVGTAPGTWKVTATGSNITASTSIVDGGAFARVGVHSGMLDGSATAKVAYVVTGTTLAGTAFTRTQEQTFSKAKAGTTPVLYSVEPEFSVITKAPNAVYTPSILAIRAYTVTGTSKSAYSGILKLYENGASTPTYISGSGESLYQYTVPTALTSLKIELYTSSTPSVLVDAQSIPVVEAGSNAILISLSNSAHTLPALSTGAVASYVSSGTDITVREGDVALTYRTSLGTNKSSFTLGTPVVLPDSSITVGSITGSGTAKATVAQHSAMLQATKVLTITYPITYVRANGGTATEYIAQTITKSADGVRGSRSLYSTDTSYASQYKYDASTAAGSASYAKKATALILASTAGSSPNTPIEGDMVTFSNGTSYVYTITYRASTSAWEPPGTVIDGSLLVTGSVTAAKINANGLVIRAADGTPILGAGENIQQLLDFDTYVGGEGKPEANATVGAPVGTLVAGMPAATVAAGVTDFNASNNRNSSTVIQPLVHNTGGTVDHTINSDGSADLSIEWYWPYDCIFVGSIFGSTLTVTEVISGTIPVGTALSGSSVTIADTYITGNLTGTGGVGTYSVSTNYATQTASNWFWGTPVAGVTASISGSTLTVTAVRYGRLFVGQRIRGTGVNPGTYISALGTGTGWLGTYTLSLEHSLGSRTILADVPESSIDGFTVTCKQSNLVTRTVSSVSTATGTITTTAAHGFALGSAVLYTATATVISGLVSGNTYYVIPRTLATELQLASSEANAIAGTFIPLTSSGTGHTLIGAVATQVAGGSQVVETSYNVPANKRSFIMYGAPANKAYSFGITAYRAVDAAINSSGVIRSALTRPSIGSESPYVPAYNTAFSGNITGTINNVSAATVASAAINFNSSNDRNGTAITLPTIPGAGAAVDHTLRADGSVDISFEWAWAGAEGDIDGFIVLVYQSDSSTAYSFGTSPELEVAYTVPASKRAFILFGAAATNYYTFGVRAYRGVDKDISSSGVVQTAIVKSTVTEENPYRPATEVAFSGNITGTVNKIAAADINVWSKVSGAGKPLDNAGNVVDTRNDNKGPSAYAIGNVREFKTCSVIGITTTATYCVLETIKGWTDGSGGQATQWAYVTSGEVWKRSALNNATTWQAWVRDLDRSVYTGDLAATKNAISQGTLANRPTGSNGDFYYATDTFEMFQKIGGVWAVTSNRTSIDTSGNIQGAGASSGTNVANNVDNVIRAPGGGVLVSATVSTGRIKVALPVLWGGNLLRFTVDILEYATGFACTLEVAGYIPSGGWLGVTARVIGSSNVEYPVYFGRDATSSCIWIGSASTNWNYPQVRVRDVLVGLAAAPASTWGNGWRVAVDATAIQPNTTASGTAPLAENQYNISVLDTLPGADWAKVSGTGRPANNATVGAPSGTYVGATLAQTVESNANGAYSAINNTTTGLATKLAANARNALSGAGGLSVGGVTWDSSGNYTGGTGIGITAKGIAAYTSDGKARLAIGTDGNATFGGTLSANAINAVNTINIAGNAVTVPQVASATAAITGTGGFQTVLTTSITLDTTATVLASFTCKQGFRSTPNRWKFYMYIDGGTAVFEVGGEGGEDSVSLVGAKSIAVGATPKVVEIKVTWSSNANVDVINRYLWVMGAKR